MGIHIGKLTTNIRVSTDDLHLTREQMDNLVAEVVERLERNAREAEMMQTGMGVPVDAVPQPRFRR